MYSAHEIQTKEWLSLLRQHRDKNTINSQQHVNKASAQLNTAHRNRMAALTIDH